MLDNRFKFRIWDKPTSRMFYDVALGFIKAPMRSDWVCADTSDGQISYTSDRLKDIEIMQCTGLKDKNEKLIYEGDIVKDDHEALHYVEWCYDCFRLNPVCKNGYTIGIVDDEIEVIGNKFELIKE